MSLQPQMLPDKQLVLVTDSVVLVPYLPRHVARYHDWMLDPWIREMTASDPLSLPEEYDMQRLWAFDADKRTFITLDRSRLPAMSLESAAEAAAAVEAAAPALAAHAAAVPSAPSAPALAGLTGEQARALVKQLLLLPAHTRPTFDSATVAAVAAGAAASKEEDDASGSGVDGDYSAEADAFVLVPSLVIDLRQATLTTGPLAQAAAAATADNESAASDSNAAIAAAARRDALALASIALGAPDAAVGDVNLFIHEYLQRSCNNDDDEGDDDDDDDDDDGGYDDEDIALFTPAETAALHSLPRPRPRPLTAEVDIMLGDPTARGKGLALAALHALVAVAREFIGTGRLVAKIKGGNAASLKLFWGAGFAKKGYYEPFDEWELRWSEGGAQEDGRWLRQGKAAAEADKSEADAAAEGEKKRGKKLIPSVPAALDDVARRVSAQRHPGFSLMPIPLILAPTGDASPAASPEAQGETVVSPPAADAARTSTLAPRGLDALPRTGANDGWFCAWHKMEKGDEFQGYTAPDSGRDLDFRSTMFAGCVFVFAPSHSLSPTTISAQTALVHRFGGSVSSLVTHATTHVVISPYHPIHKKAAEDRKLWRARCVPHCLFVSPDYLPAVADAKSADVHVRVRVLTKAEAKAAKGAGMVDNESTPLASVASSLAGPEAGVYRLRVVVPVEIVDTLLPPLPIKTPSVIDLASSSEEDDDGSCPVEADTTTSPLKIPQPRAFCAAPAVAASAAVAAAESRAVYGCDEHFPLSETTHDSTSKDIPPSAAFAAASAASVAACLREHCLSLAPPPLHLPLTLHDPDIHLPLGVTVGPPSPPPYTSSKGEESGVPLWAQRMAKGLACQARPVGIKGKPHRRPSQVSSSGYDEQESGAEPGENRWGTGVCPPYTYPGRRRALSWRAALAVSAMTRDEHADEAVTLTDDDDDCEDAHQQSYSAAQKAEKTEPVSDSDEHRLSDEENEHGEDPAPATPKESPNAALLAALSELEQAASATLHVPGNMYRATAYRRAQSVVRSLAAPITTPAAALALAQLPGVGPRVAQKLAEVVERGVSAKQEAIRAGGGVAAASDLNLVHGVGVAEAARLRGKGVASAADAAAALERSQRECARGKRGLSDFVRDLKKKKVEQEVSSSSGSDEDGTDADASDGGSALSRLLSSSSSSSFLTSVRGLTSGPAFVSHAQYECYARVLGWGPVFDEARAGFLLHASADEDDAASTAQSQPTKRPRLPPSRAPPRQYPYSAPRRDLDLRHCPRPSSLFTPTQCVGVAAAADAAAPRMPRLEAAAIIARVRAAARVAAAMEAAAEARGMPGATTTAAAVAAAAAAASKAVVVVACGSYRRGSSHSGDCDVLITSPLWAEGVRGDIVRARVLGRVLVLLQGMNRPPPTPCVCVCGPSPSAQTAAAVEASVGSVVTRSWRRNPGSVALPLSSVAHPAATAAASGEEGEDEGDWSDAEPASLVIKPPPGGLCTRCGGTVARTRQKAPGGRAQRTRTRVRSLRSLPFVTGALQGSFPDPRTCCGARAVAAAKAAEALAKGTLGGEEGKSSFLSFSPLPASSHHHADGDDSPSTTWMGYTRLPPWHPHASGVNRRLDLKIYPASAFPFAILYFTGSGHFNRSMRFFANRLGWSLSDSALVPALRVKKQPRREPAGVTGSSATTGTGGGMIVNQGGGEALAKGKSIFVRCEEDVFSALGLEWVPPGLRNTHENPGNTNKAGDEERRESAEKEAQRAEEEADRLAEVAAREKKSPRPTPAPATSALTDESLSLPSLEMVE